MRFVWSLLVLGAIALIGCNGGVSPSSSISTKDYDTFRFATGMYGIYLQEHGGKAPPDEQTYRAFVESKTDVLERMKRTADELLTSPLSGEPLVFVYGKKPPRAPTGGTYVAYEKTPVDGKRLVIGGRGGFEEMDEAQFKKLFPDVQ